MLEPPTTGLTCETENQMMNVKSLTPGGGVPAKGTPTVKSVNMVLEDPRGMQSMVQMIMEQKKMLP